MDIERIVEHAVAYVQAFFAGEYSGHDFYHTMRVYTVAKDIARAENANIGIVSLAALLHDVDDRKLSPETAAAKANAVGFLQREGVPAADIARICTIIDEVSFNGVDSVVPATIEGKCVQDADRLDAIGAIGIARAFAYGGSHHRDIYDPAVPPVPGMDKETYQKHTSTSLNHFYEKLFLLKDMMNTDTARSIAERRDAYMRAFVEEFLREWAGKDCR